MNEQHSLISRQFFRCATNAPYGRHDLRVWDENLFVGGSPTLPTGGCTTGTLTFVALTLRSAEKIAESQRSAPTSG